MPKTNAKTPVLFIDAPFPIDVVPPGTLFITDPVELPIEALLKHPTIFNFHLDRCEIERIRFIKMKNIFRISRNGHSG
jgi:hypothetical protein